MLTAAPPPQSRPWWSTFFDDAYAQFGLVPHTAEARDRAQRAASFLRDALALRPGDTVFDQCCGIGRISAPLAESGLDVIGVDLMPAYVDEARRRTAGSSTSCSFFAEDAARFSPPRSCDGAFNWFTSFGYHRDDRENRAVVERAFASLKPGAAFALDYYNVVRAIAEREASCSSRIRIGEEEVHWQEETSLDLASGMMIYAWTFVRQGGRRETRTFENRLFMPHELVRLMLDVGFEDIRLFGGDDAQALGPKSPRCIVVGQRPKD